MPFTAVSAAPVSVPVRARRVVALAAIVPPDAAWSDSRVTLNMPTLLESAAAWTMCRLPCASNEMSPFSPAAVPVSTCPRYRNRLPLLRVFGVYSQSRMEPAADLPTTKRPLSGSTAPPMMVPSSAAPVRSRKDPCVPVKAVRVPWSDPLTIV